MFTDAIMALLGWIFDGVTSIATSDSNLTINLSDFNSSLYSWSVLILKNVAMVMFSLFALLELHHAALSAQGQGINSIPAELIFKVLFRVALAKLAMDSILLIMTAIYEASTYLTVQINNILVSSPDSPAYDVESLRAGIEDLGFGMQLLDLIIFFVVFLITKIATIYAQILISTRFIQIYVYLAVSPIPASTLLNDQHSATGKNFLKAFASVCIHGTLLFLVLTFFPVIMSGALSQSTDAAEAVWSAFLYSLVLVFSLGATNRWGKQITGAA